MGCSKLSVLCLAALLLLCSLDPARAQPGRDVQHGEWRHYAGDLSSTKYSPLDQIDKDTVKRVRIAWQREALDDAVKQKYPRLRVTNNFQSTPLMVGGILYASIGPGTVAAMDAVTGRTIWVTDPAGENEQVGGAAKRGVAYWRDGDDERIIYVSGEHLVAIDAKTGAPVATFGDHGKVDLKLGVGKPVSSYSWSSVPLVARNVIVVGGSVQGSSRETPPSTVRGYDARSGRQLWRFETIPGEGDYGNETWEDGSWESTGKTYVWSWMSADDELGYVYLPTSTPTNDWYGGRRHGDNLFAESLICLDLETGRRVWHFQAVHHGLWDYDFPAAPNLLDINVDGRLIKAVAIVSKQAFTYVFDRVTGRPVWPIEERPVPPSTVPGEKAAATQPFPTEPPAFDQQGITTDDLIDFTPELRREALQILNQYVYGPLFQPGSLEENGKKGTIQMPGSVGGANWTGAAVDPETGLLYVPSVHSPINLTIVPVNPDRSNARFVRRGYEHVAGPLGLPLFKPPYGRITAIDLNRGEHVWVKPNGEGPRNHPAIEHLNLPWLGQPGRASPLVTKSLLFMAEGAPDGARIPPGGGGKKFRAYDKMTGEVVWEIELPAGTTGAPMTYLAGGKQYIVVAIGGGDQPASFVALSLP